MSRLKQEHEANLRDVSQTWLLHFAITVKFITMLIADRSVMFFIKMSQK
ncbi:hypothetical protein ymoll0001_11770 [Yersinia mollaretii ATCC 43969]|uniref:Uncharacterized protein n=1 Tax=Yersinia mollaretii (strain ATCC 43969 / DSM 18520 / CIP 103324 / CNY 7263 / WAIP 204) TaxID=349967 RepID=A0ABP2EKZ0_YERMW|nr:hypothetical protein ymoll0001_11770 [Yersinia mollaretii ATCC 43969]